MKLASTFHTENKYPYKYAITNAKPHDNGLWFRLPQTLKALLTQKKQKNLEDKVKEALNQKENSKKMIQEVFVDLWMMLETGFTQNQIIKIVGNLESFEHPLIVPIEHLSNNDYLINESYGPSYAFKDLALQMLTGMVANIVEEENTMAIKKAKQGEKGQILKFLVNLTSTSGDTGPAGGMGIEDKNFILNVIGFPRNESTFSQIGQMIGLKNNVIALPMHESFSDIQSAMIAGNTQEYKENLTQIITSHLSDIITKYGFTIVVDSGSFNSINPGRIDGQMIYHTYCLLQAKALGIIKENESLIEVIPSGNGGHMYSLLQARILGHVTGPTIVSCNKNDMFYKIFHDGKFQKISGNAVHQASVSMIIEYPNNMIRLFSYAFGPNRAKEISDLFFSGKEVILSQQERDILKNNLQIFCYCIPSEEELETIGEIFKNTQKLVCPHTANAIAGLKKYRQESKDLTTKALISETASPWKFLAAITAGISDSKDSEKIKLYEQYRNLEKTKEGCQKLIEMIQKEYLKLGYTWHEDLIPNGLFKIYQEGYSLPPTISAHSFHENTLKFVESYLPKWRQQIESVLK